MRELKRYKEELALVGLLSLVLVIIRWVSATVWPTTGQYDLAAQTETVFWTMLRVVIYALAAWMGLRVVAPKAYMHLKHNIVDQFDLLPEGERSSFSLRMFAILFFGLVFLAMSGCNPAQAAVAADQRNCVVERAAADVGVREATGHNDGPEVERYLAHVGLGKGHPWCAAFVSYHLSGCGVRNPKSGWSPAFSGVSARVWSPRKATRMPMPGDVFSIYYPSLGRVGHVGLVTGLDGGYITTIEGNTSGPGGREGDGVYARRRQLSKVHAVTNYINDEGNDGRIGLLRGNTGAGALRVQGAAQRGQRYAGDHRNGDQPGAQGYTAARAEGQRAPAATAAGARAGRAGKEQAQGPRNHYGEREPGQRAGGLRVRHGEHKGPAVGPLHADEQEHGDHNQGSGSENQNARLGVVDGGRCGGIHTAAPAAGQHQTPLAR